jgi:hypothetical protein
MRYVFEKSAVSSILGEALPGPFCEPFWHSTLEKKCTAGVKYH